MKSLIAMLALAFGLCACVPAPVTFTPVHLEPYSSPTPTPFPILTSTVQPAFTTTPVPTSELMPAGFSPILYGRNYDKTAFLLIGGIDGTAWLDPAASVARFAGAAGYSIHTFSNNEFQTNGNAPQLSMTCKNYFVETDAVIDEFGLVGVAQGWQVTQKAPEELLVGDDFYQKEVMVWLKDQGVVMPQVGGIRVFRIDIEGDGVDEIFISATHLDESQHLTKLGDYSIVLMRKVAGNDVVTVLLAGDVYHSQSPEITYPRTYSPGSFIDLDQDGILEVIVDIQRWEGFGAIVFRVNERSVTQLLRAECPQ